MRNHDYEILYKGDEHWTRVPDEYCYSEEQAKGYFYVQRANVALPPMDSRVAPRVPIVLREVVEDNRKRIILNKSDEPDMRFMN